MERALLKLAKQLNQYDEGSLMALWNVYARKVSKFEPSSRWEEDALALCMIQAMHWKNQLFNAELAASARRGAGAEEKDLRETLAAFSKHERQEDRKTPDAAASSARTQCTLITFPRDDSGWQGE